MHYAELFTCLYWHVLAETWTQAISTLSYMLSTYLILCRVLLAENCLYKTSITILLACGREVRAKRKPPKQSLIYRVMD